MALECIHPSKAPYGYIRNLIVGYEIKIPVIKEEYLIENVIKALEENIECLNKVKNRFRYLEYLNDEEAIGVKIKILKVLNNTVRKKLINEKDNAN